MSPSTFELVKKLAERTYRACLRRYEDPTLCGYCAVATAHLHKQLSKVGVSSSFLYHHNGYSGHVFLRVADSFVDITARQFDFDHPPVVIRHIEEHSEFPEWRDVLEVPTLTDLVKIQQRDLWPTNQWASLT